jgi:hypothetical protein
MGVGITLVDDAIRHPLLVYLSVVDLLLEAVVDDEAINETRFSLPVSVHSADGLRVMAGVPRRVQHHDAVRTDQIYAERTRSGRHQEQVDLGVGVELVYELLALEGAGGAVQT